MRALPESSRKHRKGIPPFAQVSVSSLNLRLNYQKYVLYVTFIIYIKYMLSKFLKLNFLVYMHATIHELPYTRLLHTFLAFEHANIFFLKQLYIFQVFYWEKFILMMNSSGP